MYVRNTKAHLCNQCCRLKAINSICLYACLSFPACKLQLICAALYCHLWPVWLYHALTALSNDWYDFREKKLRDTKLCVLISSINLVWNISPSQKNSARYYHKPTHVSILSQTYTRVHIITNVHTCPYYHKPTHVSILSQTYTRVHIITNIHTCP